jgi:hypothetical protein
MRKIFGLTLIVASAAFMMHSASQAAPSPRIDYTITATFNDGGTISGSFIFDPNAPCAIPNCSAYSSINITTSAWNLTGLCQHTQSSYGTPNNVTSRDWLAFSSPLLFRLVFVSDLGSAGAVELQSDGSSVEWDGAGCERIVTAGSVVGVPEGGNSTTTSSSSTTTDNVSTSSSSTTTDNVSTSSSSTTTDNATTSTDVEIVVPTTSSVLPSAPPLDTTTTVALSGVLPATGNDRLWWIAAAAALIAIGLTARRTADR